MPPLRRLMRLSGLDEAGEEQGAARQLGDHDRFVQGVSAFADGPQTVERGSDTGGEVSVGAAADRGFFQFPIDIFCDGVGFFIQADDACISLHRHAVDAALEMQLTMFVERLQRMQLAIERGRLLRAGDAHINFDLGMSGDDVGAGSSANDAGIG